jgi:hypothetical protein
VASDILDGQENDGGPGNGREGRIRPTVNADDHSFVQNFHRPEDGKRMIMLADAARGIS